MSGSLDYRGLGKEIRRRRKRLRMTQRTLASQAGISLSFLGHIERGSRKASVETLVGIAIALDASMSDLLCDSLPVKGRVNDFPSLEEDVEVIRKALDRIVGKA